MNRIAGWCVAASLLTGMGWGATGPTSMSDEQARARFRQLERDIPSLYLLNGLNLSAEQAAKLGAIVDRVGTLEERYDRKLERVLRSHDRDARRDLDEVVTSASLGRGPADWKEGQTPRGERLRNARAEFWGVQSQKHGEIAGLADEAFELLTESQRRVLARFTPCFIPPQDFKNPERVGQAAADTSFAERVLDKLRKVPEAEFAGVAMDRALEALTEHTLQKRRIPYSEAAEAKVRAQIKAKLVPAANRARAMGEADFELDKAKLAAGVEPLEDPDAPDNPDERRWKTTHYVLNAGLADVLQSRGGAARKVSERVEERPDVKAALDLGTEVKAARLIAGLRLSREQAAGVLKVVRDALDTRAAVEKDAGQAMRDALPAYGALRGELAAGQPTPKAEEHANRAHGRVRRLHEEELVAKLRAHEQRLDAVLSAPQVACLAGEGPGEAPAGADARRRGFAELQEDVEQAQADARRLLAEARRMPEAVFKSKQDALCRQYVAERLDAARWGRASADVETEAKRIAETLVRAREMSQSDYAKNAESLVADLCPKLTGPRPALYGAKYHRGEPVPLLAPTTRLLFSETACRVLEKMAGTKSAARG